MNAWLDDLSEDWVPPPSSPPNLSGVDGSSESERPKSRIPRYQNPAAPTSSIRRAPGRSLKIRQAIVSKGVLTERTHSENNIQLSSDSDADLPPTKTATNLRTVSASSTQSVVHHELEDETGTVAVGRGRRDHDTPEWKRRLLRGEMGYGDRKDLFSPIGLQSIFNKPDEGAHSQPADAHVSMSFLKGMETLPSSPPPWPANGKTRTTQMSSDSHLNMVEEEPDARDQSESFGESGDLSPANTIQRISPGDSSQGAEKDWSPDAGNREEKNLEEQRSLAIQDKLEESRVVSGRTELDEGFSPVFISKHNTTDGRIDYAALDLSKTELEQQLERLALRNSSISTTQRHGQDTASHEDSVSQSQSDLLPDSILTGTPHSYDVGEFVSTRRGGYSADGSFVRRPLSPSPVKERDTLSTVADDSAEAQFSVEEQFADGSRDPRAPIHDDLPPIAPSPPRSSTASPTSESGSVRIHSQFGQGELDGHCFEDDLAHRFGSAQFKDVDFTPAASPSPTMHPPGFKEPSKYRPCTVTQSFVLSHKRKLSKLSLKSHLSVDKRSTRNVQPTDVVHHRPSSPVALEAVEGKRPPNSPRKDPTPKRRRTLHLEEMGSFEPVKSREPSGSDSGHSIIGRKRKDARYDETIETARPEVLARRQILRPRNPTPSQRRRQEFEDEILDATEAFMESSPRLHTIQEHLLAPAAPGTTAEKKQARAVASEVAAFTVRMAKARQDERKKSVTTQDFLDEAMKIMSFIRNRGRARDGTTNTLAQDADFGSDVFDEHALDSTALTFDRPPSREGGGSGWRTRAVQQDRGIVEHLQKYQDDEDEDFVASSFRSLRIDRDEPSDEESDGGFSFSDELDIPIRGPIRHADYESEDGVGTHGTTESNTQNSAQSSLVHTNVTTTSKRSDNVATLAPEAVAHLIPEEIGCMTFDRERGIWVKNKSPKKPPKSNGDVSSVSQSDDNVLDLIPDLSVNGTDENIRVMSRKEGTLRQRLLQAHHRGIDRLAKSTVSESQTDDLQAERPITREGAPAPVTSSSVPSKYTAFASSVPQVETRATSWSDQSASARGTIKGPTPPPPSVHPASVEQNVEQDDVEKDDVEQDDVEQDDVEQNDVEHEIGIEEGRRPAGRVHSLRVNSIAVSFSSPGVRGQSKVSPGRPEAQEPRSAWSSSTAETQTASDQSCSARQVNFSLAVTRPSVSPPGEVLQYSPGQQITDVTFLLSELPDFTMNQVDERELPQRTLVKRYGQELLCSREDRFHEGNAALVKALQDIEPDEPFWEDLRELSLDNQRLTSLHLLDLLCERVEHLSVSNNSLAQMVGVPTSTRSLNADRNLLTGLTTWGHLVNLQYLDVSNNDIEDLIGFHCLVHLRRLNADDNRIASLDGILGLDGLLEMSLKGNRISVADFTGAELKRLTKLNLASNGTEKLVGIDSLQALVDLNLDDNQLEETPLGAGRSRGLKMLRSLSMRRNGLTELPISCDDLLLESLNLDGNRLPRRTTLERLKRLQRLSIRDQRPHCAEASGKDEVFVAAPEVQEMYLSLNPLPALTMTHAFHNMRRLELASCGIQVLPENFGQQVESLRFLNLNFNALKDLRPLLNIKRLEELHVAGNRLQRLRKPAAVLALLQGLATLDLRDNPFSLGFYPPVTEVVPQTEDVDGGNGAERGRRFILADGSRERDEQHVQCMDEDTRLRRRVYQILVANSCRSLRQLDGLAFSRKQVLVKDELWARLEELGVVRKSHRAKKGDGVSAGV